MMHIADNQDALLDYLYEEGDPVERLAIGKHLQECTRCSVAVLEFQTVRGMLTEWTPPAAPLGFRIVQDADTAPSASEEQRARGGWSWGWGRTMQAAAAAVLFLGGMAVSSLLDVEYQAGAVTVRSRSADPAPAARTASITLPAAADVAASADNRSSGPAAGQTADVGVARSGDELLRQVQAMIEQSEIRQRRELALRLSQVAREVDTQHRADLLRIQQNLGQIEMETGAQIDQQQRMVDYLVRTSLVAK